MTKRTSKVFTYWIDMTGVFDDVSADEELYIDAYHVGDKGYRLLAETMAPWLERFLPAK